VRLGIGLRKNVEKLEHISEGGDMVEVERMGWKRTFLLAIGAGVGVLATAYLIHLMRR